MKELRDSLTQLIAIIMITITFAISMAAFSQWVNSASGTIGESDASQQSNALEAPSLSASVVR